MKSLSETEEKEVYHQRFGGVARLFGKRAQERIRDAHICVVGLGGVGSWTVEALARSGVGRMTLIDLDDVCVTNTNRQVHAVEKVYGMNKVAAMKERVRMIAPLAEVTVCPAFLTHQNVNMLLSERFDCVVDAIDSVKNKCEIIAAGRQRGIPIVTVGGAGGRVDATQIRVADLAQTIRDPLLKAVRKKLRRHYSAKIPSGPMFGVNAVYSTESMRYPDGEGEVCDRPVEGQSLKMDCESGYGAACFVTGSFGFAAAGCAVELLVNQSKAAPSV